MEGLVINSFFSKEDKEFNREMVRRSLGKEKSFLSSEHRGGKMSMNSMLENRLFQNRQYDFASGILSDYRRKWGLSE